MMESPYGGVSAPSPHAPPSAQTAAASVNTLPNQGVRANGTRAGKADASFARAEREVEVLNHCFDDIELFMGKLQKSAEAASVLNQRKKKKKKTRKQSDEDDLLTAKARPPPQEEFVGIFQKFKYCFSLLARLKPAISNPTSEELLHHVFKPLEMIVRTTGGPALAASVVSPALTGSAVTLLKDNLTEEEKQLWNALGPNWTLSSSQLRGPVAPYTPVFYNGWKPEASQVDGQAWEDPVELQHKHEALRGKQEQQLSQPLALNNSSNVDSSVLPPEGERMYRCSYDFVARNSSELSVLQGDTLEVVESSKRWWKCRNRFNEVGFVPFNILEPMAHIDSPVTHMPPKAPALSPMMSKTFSYTPPSPPALPNDSLAPRPASMPSYSHHHIPSSNDTDKAMMVNDELLQRLANGKPSGGRALVIPRSSDTTAPMDFHSPPAEVEHWLRAKGFSEPTVLCLGVLSGAQLFSLTKEELRAVIPDEGARVYSQITVQKALLEDARKATELEAVMEKQKQKVDLKLESSTL